MPLEIDDFDSREHLPIDRTKVIGRNQDAIYKFLKEHPEDAFSQAEIQRALDIEKPACVYVALHALKRRNDVTSKRVGSIIYWVVQV